MTRIDDVMISVQRRLRPGPGNGGYDADNWDLVMRRHLTTLNMMKATFDQLRVPSYFFFQPIMQYEDHYKIRKLSTDEEKFRSRMIADEYKRHDTLLSDALAPLRSGLGNRFFDIHDVFRGHDGEKLYADARHPNGVGNGVIAARVYQEIHKLDSPTP
jgi:hypothetical protein